MDIRKTDEIGLKDGHRLAKKEGLVQYLECSAMEGVGLTEVYDTVARAAVGIFKKKSKMCCIM